jgi:hypothetical protein
MWFSPHASIYAGSRRDNKGVKESLPIVLAGLALVAAIVQMVRPFTARLPAGVLFVVALLFALRWLIRRQQRNRAKMVDDVPKRPLGIDD